MTREFRFICVLDSVNDSGTTLSTLDASPDYLHIHILKSSFIDSSIDDFASRLNSEGINYDMYQWGTPFEKEAKVRSAKVSAQEVKSFAQVGIGSAARGESEAIGDFIGGGEGFLFNNKNYRVTKGNKAFSVSDEEKYWTFQGCDFNGSRIIEGFKGVTVHGRENLLNLLKRESTGMPFVAVFDVEFLGNYLARSNGIFPEDREVVDNLDNVFHLDIQGGHLLGGSINKGDLESLANYDPTMVDGSDFSLFYMEQTVVL